MTPLPLLAGLLGETGAWAMVVAGVGLIIFIHEGGHFVAAKWAGVKVLAFSLGFGPEMFGFTRGTTRYRISWIPLGGYVKMSGETELPEGGYGPDDFPSKPVWKRGIIMIAGVVMNAVLGFVLFAAAGLAGIDVLPPVAGGVAHGGPAWEAGLRAGDRVIAADGQPLRTFEDIVYATMPGQPLVLTVQRGGSRMEVSVVPRVVEGGPAPVIGVSPLRGDRMLVPGDGPAAEAGFHDGDAVRAVEGVPATLWDLVDDSVLDAAVLPDAGPLRLTVEREGAPVDILLHPTGTLPLIGISPHQTTVDLVRGGGPAAAAGWKAGDLLEAVGGDPVRGAVSFRRAAFRAPPGSAVGVRRGSEAVRLPLPDAPGARIDLLRDLRFAPPASPTAVEILAAGPRGEMGLPFASPAEAAGLPNGARITSVGGAPVVTFQDVARRIGEAEGKPLEIEWTGPDGGGRATVEPAPFSRYDLGALGMGVELAKERLVVDGVLEAVSFGAERCVQVTRQIVATMAGIFSGRVAKENLGGPVAIAQMTKQGTEQGTGHFLAILAMLSVNLMFLNILPIPLLDGGQLMLLSVEAVTRKPPREWLVVFSQWLGLILLLGLMVMVTFNDIARLIRP